MTTARQLIDRAAACADCGKEHKPRKISASQETWAANDGHAYRPVIHTLTNQSAGPVLAALRKLAELYKTIGSDPK